MEQVDPAALPYAMVKVTPDVENILERNSVRIGRVFIDRRGPAEIRFGIGDTVSVTIFEAAAGGLFIPVDAGVRPGNYVTLPNQPVDTQGNITVPYAGNDQGAGTHRGAGANGDRQRAEEPRTRAAGGGCPRRPEGLLDQRARRSRHAVPLPGNAAGERLLDAISRAGGPRNPGYDTFVMLEREGRQATAPFGSLLNEPTNNIYVRPQDTIYVFTQPQTFVAFGASGQQGQFNFGAWRLSIAEALGKTGGLNDNLADPASVYLYRGERREVAEQLGIDCSRFSGPVVPVIYNLNLRDPAGYFLATKFEMHNKDVHLCVELDVGRSEQAADLSAIDHSHRQRSADGRRQCLHRQGPCHGYGQRDSRQHDVEREVAPTILRMKRLTRQRRVSLFDIRGQAIARAPVTAA